MDNENDTNPKVSQVARNFNRIARDLDRAIRAAHFSAAQRVLIDEAREASWSFSLRDPRPFTLNFSAIARNLRFERMGLSRQFRRLVADRVFVDLGDGRYLINKDYRDWLDQGRPRLSPEQIGWCLRVKRKGRTEHAGTHPPEHTGTQSGFSGVSTGSRTPCVKSTQGVSTGSRTPCVKSTHTGPESLVVPPDPRIGTRTQARAKVSYDSSLRESFIEGGRESPPPFSDGSSAQRSAEERALVLEAERLLRSDLRTEAIGLELGRSHNAAGMAEVPAWKFLRAAQRLLSPEVQDAKRGRWSYFLGIVRGLTDAERDERPATKKETVGERRSREIKEQVAAMKAKCASGGSKEADHAGR